MIDTGLRLFLVVHRSVGEVVLEDRVEVSLEQLARANNPGEFLLYAVNTTIAQVSQHG